MTQFSNKFEFVQYSGEAMLPDVQRLVSTDLSEPYSVFLYRFFLNNWPNLCICCYPTDSPSRELGKMVACIVCKAEMEEDKDTPGEGPPLLKGYIGMLAVNKEFRKQGLGLELARRGINQMIKINCQEIYLEAEESNVGALRLYEKLGFIRDEKLAKYYLNGSNAYRLKLFPLDVEPPSIPEEAKAEAMSVT